MVEAISSSLEVFNSIESILTSFGGIDLDQLLVNFVQLPKLSNTSLIKLAEKKIEYVIHAKHVISLVDPLKQALESCDAKLFEKYIEQLNDSNFADIKRMIDQVVNSNVNYTKGNVNMKLEKCFAIKDRFNALLDLARSMYSESIDDMVALVKSYGN